MIVAGASDGEPLIDLGRGNPETGPPQHVIDALAEAARRDTAHGYPPFRGVPELREAIARRYREVYGVELDPSSEVAVIPGTKSGIVERINLLNDHCRVGIFRPIQEACIAALTGPQDSVAERRDTYQRRRDRVIEVLGPLTCEGTFYLWLELPEGVTFESLLTEHRLVVAPGEGFGPSGAGWVRLSLAVSDETLERGLERLAGALA